MTRSKRLYVVPWDHHVGEQPCPEVVMWCDLEVCNTASSTASFNAPDCEVCSTSSSRSSSHKKAKAQFDSPILPGTPKAASPATVEPLYPTYCLTVRYVLITSLPASCVGFCPRFNIWPRTRIPSVSSLLLSDWTTHLLLSALSHRFGFRPFQED